MKYMMLIHQGPSIGEFESLPEDEKRAIGGYLLFEAEDLDAAIELASRIPAARQGGAIEVRPIVER
jgi:hypothetical protein